MVKKSTSKAETINVNGTDVVNKIKELLKEGNIRKISIEDKSGKTIATMPLNIGIFWVVLAPTFALLGVAAALLSECTIKVERKI